MSLLLHLFVLAVILSAAKDPDAFHEPYRSNLSPLRLPLQNVFRIAVLLLSLLYS